MQAGLSWYVFMFFWRPWTPKMKESSARDTRKVKAAPKTKAKAKATPKAKGTPKAAPKATPKASPKKRAHGKGDAKSAKRPRQG